MATRTSRMVQLAIVMLPSPIVRGGVGGNSGITVVSGVFFETNHICPRHMLICAIDAPWRTAAEGAAEMS